MCLFWLFVLEEKKRSWTKETPARNNRFKDAMRDPVSQNSHYLSQLNMQHLLDLLSLYDPETSILLGEKVFQKNNFFVIVIINYSNNPPPTHAQVRLCSRDCGLPLHHWRRWNGAEQKRHRHSFGVCVYAKKSFMCVDLKQVSIHYSFFFLFLRRNRRANAPHQILLMI